MTKSYLCVLISVAFLGPARAYAEQGPANAALKRYTIESIEFDSGGMKRSFKDKKLLEKLDIETGDDFIWAETASENLEKFYREKGFAFARVTHRSEELGEGKMKLTYVIDEGPILKIGRISFIGNSSIKEDDLKKLLKTAKKSWFFWPLNYVQEQAAEDVKRLKNVYWEQGFLAHRITYSLNPDILDPAVIEQQRQKKKCSVNITFVIEEGPLYTVEKILLRFVDTKEDIILKSTNRAEEQMRKHFKTFDEAQLRPLVETEPGQIYNERRARADAERMLKLYAENGYIDAKVQLLSPVFIPDTSAVNTEFEIFEGRQFRIGRIDITGNREIKDTAVRRILDEYDFFPGNIYNADIAPKERRGKLKTTIQTMTYAEDVTIEPMGEAYGPKDVNVFIQDVEVNIKEGLTGQIFPGVGLSSDHGFLGQLIYDERNFDITDWPESIDELIPGRAFRGAGQTLEIRAEPGTEVSQYLVSFGEPYFGGEPNKPIRLGVTGSSWERYLESHEEGRLKGFVEFAKRYDKGFWRRSIGFRVENVEVDDIEPDAPTEIIDVEGDNFLAGIMFGIKRNSTDDERNPTTGSIFDAGYEQVGGDHTFGILKGTQRWYRTIHEDLAERKTVLAVKLLGATTVGDAPPFEKFYGGGTGRYGIRGFDFRGVSTRGGIDDDPIGSDWIFLANAEVSVPLVEESLSALFFVDSGTIDSGGYRAAVGTGIQIMIPQWFGPVPMRFELGVPVMKNDEDDTRVFSFSVGRLF